MNRYTVKATLHLLGLLFGLSFCARTAAAQNGNLLQHARVVDQRGVTHPERLTDNKIAPAGTAVANSESAIMTGLHPYVVFDFGHPVVIDALAIQADNNDHYRVGVSNNPKRFSTVWKVPVVGATGMQVRQVTGLGARGRYLRIDCTRGDRVRAVTELWAYTQAPSPFPPAATVSVSLNLDDDDVAEERVYSWYLVLGFLALFLLFYVHPRLTIPRARRALEVTLLLAAALAWPKFGVMHGKTALQVWDGYHYFLSSKYFDEIGYFDLYRCVAKAEREAGYGKEIDQRIIRDLDDNTIHPGSWTTTKEGACRGAFTTKRWILFKKDVAAYRKLFPDELPLLQSFVDHGFNATPVHAAWLRLLTRHIPVSKVNLMLLAQIDSLAIVLSILLLWWAFGPKVAISAALVISLGYDWGYRWVGGSLGRFPWLLFACGGLAFLKKERPATGAALLTVSGLLRLFPFTFVGALGLGIIIDWIRRRRLSEPSRRQLVAIFTTLAVGVLFGGMVVGFRSYGHFMKVVEVHANTPLVNHMGLPMITGARVGDLNVTLNNAVLSDPNQIWTQKLAFNRAARQPLWLFGVAASLGFIILVSLKRFAPWQVTACGGPLLFCLHNMTSYDYVFLVLMLPLGMGRPKRLIYAVLYTLFTVAVGVFTVDMESQHIAHSLGFLALMVYYVYDVGFAPHCGDLPKKQTQA